MLDDKSGSSDQTDKTPGLLEKEGLKTDNTSLLTVEGGELKGKEIVLYLISVNWY